VPGRSGDVFLRDWKMRKTDSKDELSLIVRRFIADAGNMTQSLGIGRVLGQIYAYLYFSSMPRNLADMQETLGISKGSASTGVRQLGQWGAVRKVWVKGDRKDYYEAGDWFGRIVKKAVLDTVAKKMSSYTSLLEEIESDLSEFADSDCDSEGEFIRKRVKHLHEFHERAQKLWQSALLRKLLK